MGEFNSWLDETNLNSFKQLFLENGYDKLEVVVAMTDTDLKVTLPGHRKKILLKVSSLRKRMKVDEVAEDIVTNYAENDAEDDQNDKQG